jgi:hypothetical protein
MQEAAFGGRMLDLVSGRLRSVVNAFNGINGINGR